MKKLFVIGIAALLLPWWPLPPHAGAQLPDDFLGYWCFNERASPNDGEEHYYDKDYEDCDEWYTAIFKDDDGNHYYYTDLIMQGLKEPRADLCAFDKIEAVDVPSRGEHFSPPIVFLVHAKCKSLNGVDPPWEERFELQWDEDSDVLIIRRLADS